MRLFQRIPSSAYRVPLACWLAAPLNLLAYDLNEQWSVDGVLAGAAQCQQLSGDGDSSDSCRGGLPFRPVLRFTPTASDTFQLGLGFAAGNGLNKKSPFELSPWAADLHDEVKDINGRGRDHLLNAWYRRDFRFTAENVLSITVGIIDSTEFLDNNAYANDEYTQFMNEAFVNSPQVFLPSYDRGMALQWDVGPWSARTVIMNVGKKADDSRAGTAAPPLTPALSQKEKEKTLSDRDLGSSYNYAGVELGYTLHTDLGEGHYRVLWSRTSRDFVDPSGSSAEHRGALALSFDQQLGDDLGAFLRVDIQSDNAAITYKYLNSAGIDLNGRLWGRPRDNIGLAAGYLSGGNQNINNTRVAEGYYRLRLHERMALSLDLQYLKDSKRSGKNPAGIIAGLRADIHF